MDTALLLFAAVLLVIAANVLTLGEATSGRTLEEISSTRVGAPS